MINFFKHNQFVFNYRRMWPFIKPYWGRALLGVLLTVPVGGLDAVMASFLKPITDNVLIAKQASFSQALPFIIVSFTLIQGGLNYSATYINTWVGSKIAIGLKRVLYGKLLTMDSIYLDQRNSGDILLRYSNDPELASSGLISNLKLFLTKLFSSLALIGVMIYNSWQLTVIAIGIFIFAVYPVKYVRQKIRNISHKTVEATSSFLTIYNETFSGNRIIRSFTLENKFREKFNKSTDVLFRLMIKMTQGSGWLSPLLHFIGSIGLALVMWLGTSLILNETISPGNFIAFIGAMMMLYTPLKSIGSNYVVVQQSFLAIERIYDILDTEPAIKSIPDAIVLDSIKQGIEFKNISFGYHPEHQVLQNVSFDIKVGQTVALVGASGGGKTTICSLLLRLYDITEGEILIDGIDIKNYNLESLRENIGVVFQDNFLFSGTIRENLILGKADATEKEMWQALEDANIADFVASKKDKLDTEIGERGTLLSGGQKQRIAIARALIKNAPLVILDEATSALDNQSEKVIQEAMDSLMESQTVIVIAHRLSTVQNADKILVINNGRLVEEGRHKELMDKGGAYYSLYASQFDADNDQDKLL